MSQKKTVFITGASSGIGRGFALYYGKRGYKVFLTARREPLLKSLVSGLNSERKELVADYFAGDLTQECDIRVCINQALDFLGPIDLIICNAGIGDRVTVENFSTKRIKKLYDVNVFAVLQTIEGFLPTFLKQKKGHIVAVASLAAYISSPRIHPYSATKAALKSHMEGLAKELRPYGVDVSCLCPGFIKTDMTAGLKKPLPFLMELETAVEKMAKAIDAKKEVYAFPWQLLAAIKFMGLVPNVVKKWKIFN